jgi:hypothetical protein
VTLREGKPRRCAQAAGGQEEVDRHQPRQQLHRSRLGLCPDSLERGYCRHQSARQDDQSQDRVDEESEQRRNHHAQGQHDRYQASL